MPKIMQILSSGTAAVLLLAGCATSPAPEPASTIRIEEAVGFTITEDATVPDDLRLEYDAALSYLQQGDLDIGIRRLESVASAAPGLSAPRIDLGIAYRQAGDLDGALRNLLLAISLNPEHPSAYNELGIVYRHLGRFSEARQAYEAALAIYPGFHFARRNLAVLCDLYLGDRECALANYEAYMQTVPSDDEASMWIADLRLRMAGEG